VLAEMLKLCGDMELKEGGIGLVVELTAVLMQLLAVPSVSTHTGNCGAHREVVGDDSSEPDAGTLTAAEAVDSLSGAVLTWNHLDESSMAAAGFGLTLFCFPVTLA
jgi:hypothetical protein